MHRAIGSLAAIAGLTGGSLAAQLPELEAGTRVRIHASGTTLPLTGTVVWQDAERLAVLRAPADTAILPLSAITRADVSRGRRSNVLRGARTGALIGAGVGLALGVAALAEENDDSWFDYGTEVIPLGALGGGFLGGSVGLLIGALSSSEVWTPAGTTITFSPAGGRVTLGAVLAF